MNKFDYKFKALWTLIHIIIISDKDPDNKIKFIFNEIKKFDEKYSRFNKKSLLSKLNDKKEIDVDEDFLWLFIKCNEIFKLSNWYFNPLVNISNLWYSDDYNKWIFKKTKEEVNIEFDEIKLFGNKIILKKWMKLDFWAIWKWYLADKIKLILKKKWEKNFMINIWWDITVNWINKDWNKWLIWLENPLNKSLFKKISLDNKSISSSWSYARKWEAEWEEFHHIKTPYSDKQEKNIIMVSIIDKYWYRTDSLATAIFAMWLEKWLSFCKENNIEAYFFLKNNEIIHSK